MEMEPTGAKAGSLGVRGVWRGESYTREVEEGVRCGVCAKRKGGRKEEEFEEFIGFVQR